MFGLVCSGGASQLWLSRWSGFRDRLGPVKGLGIRSASRLVNQLRAGHSVASWAELAPASAIFVSLPRQQEERALAALAGPELDWNGKLLCVVDTERDAQELHPFRERGAAVLVLDRLAGGSLPCLILQGDPAGRRLVRSLAPPGQFRLLELPLGRKAVFQAGVSLAQSLCWPLLAASADAFAATGLPPTQAQLLAENLLGQMGRAFLRGGKKSWSGPVAEADLEAIERRWEGLRRSNPRLGTLFLEAAAAAARHFSRQEELACAIEKLPGRFFDSWGALRITGD